MKKLSLSNYNTWTKCQSQTEFWLHDENLLPKLFVWGFSSTRLWWVKISTCSKRKRLFQTNSQHLVTQKDTLGIKSPHRQFPFGLLSGIKFCQVGFFSFGKHHLWIRNFFAAHLQSFILSHSDALNNVYNLFKNINQLI